MKLAPGPPYPVTVRVSRGGEAWRTGGAVERRRRRFERSGGVLWRGGAEKVKVT